MERDCRKGTFQSLRCCGAGPGERYRVGSRATADAKYGAPTGAAVGEVREFVHLGSSGAAATVHVPIRVFGVCTPRGRGEGRDVWPFGATSVCGFAVCLPCKPLNAVQRRVPVMAIVHVDICGRSAWWPMSVFPAGCSRALPATLLERDGKLGVPSACRLYAGMFHVEQLFEYKLRQTLWR